MRPQRFLPKHKWQRAIVLAYLARTGVPVGLIDMGAVLATDHSTLWTALDALESMGAIEREPLPDVGTGRRRATYSVTRLIRMAAR